MYILLFIYITWNESTPINQSGDGTIRVINDTRLWLSSAKNFPSLYPSPVGINGKVNSSSIPPSFCNLIIEVDDGDDDDNDECGNNVYGVDDDALEEFDNVVIV